VRLLSYLLAYGVLSTAGVLVLRHSLSDERLPGESVLDRALSLGTVAGGLLYAGSFAVWLLALARYPVTSIYPVFVGASFIGVALGGWLLLNERLGTVQLIGALTILVGITLLAR
jgi:multidrug transporter EmrE-like cation transporter